MSVRDLMSKKGSDIISVRPEDTVETVATLLATNNIGAMPVRDAERKLVGLISERDVIRGFMQRGCQVVKMTAKQLMTPKVVTCKISDDIKNVAENMARRHFRHMPVLDGDELVGMISLRDVLEGRLQQTELEVNVLRDIAITK